MNKKELVESMAGAADISKAVAEKALNGRPKIHVLVKSSKSPPKMLQSSNLAASSPKL